MRVGFLPVGLDAAPCYRLIFPMAYLGRLGHEASMPSFRLRQGDRLIQPYPGDGLLERVPPGDLEVDFFEDTIPDADLYVFQLGTQSWTVEWAEKLKARGARIVLDMDDNVHQSPPYNPARLDPGSSPLNNRRNTQRLMEMADAATFATPALEQFYSRWCDQTFVLPNRLHWPMWDQVPPVHERRDWRRFRVGYMGSVDYHRADLETIAAPLRKWLLAHPDVEFVAAGDDRIHDIIGVPHRQRVTTRKSWFRNMDLPHITSCFDVGLVPLVRNDFNEGKSWLKGLEYSACGIVPVATPTGPYRELIRDGENGFLCRYPRDFIAALDALLGDRDMLGRMAAHAYDNARANALDRHIGSWERAYGQVLGVGDHADDAEPAVAA